MGPSALNNSHIYHYFCKLTYSCTLEILIVFSDLLLSTAVVLKLFWFTAHCKTYNNFLAHFVYKIKNILIYFKLWIKIKIMDVIHLYTNGFPLIFKIYFHNIRSTPSHILQCTSVLQHTVWESLVYCVDVFINMKSTLLWDVTLSDYTGFLQSVRCDDPEDSVVCGHHHENIKLHIFYCCFKLLWEWSNVMI
jgi:hypothetical protein